MFLREPFLEPCLRDRLRPPQLFLSLFTLMLATGIPELQRLEDIEYLRDMLSLELTVRDPTTWTILQHDGPNHLGLWCNAAPCASNGSNRLGLRATGGASGSEVRGADQAVHGLQDHTGEQPRAHLGALIGAGSRATVQRWPGCQSCVCVCDV